MLVDAIDRQSVEHVKRSHPFGVALRQIVVDGDHVDAISREGIQEHGERSHERFTFAGCHLRDFSLMQDDTSDELHVVVYHVPCDFIAAGHPMVAVYGFVAFDGKKVFSFCCQFAVEIAGCDFDCFIFFESPCCFADDGEYFGQMLVELFFERFEYFFLDSVDFFPIGFAFLVFECFDLSLDVGNFFFLVGCAFCQRFFDFCDAFAQLVVRQFGEGRVYPVYLIDYRLDFSQIALRFIAENRF